MANFQCPECGHKVSSDEEFKKKLRMSKIRFWADKRGCPECKYIGEPNMVDIDKGDMWKGVKAIGKFAVATFGIIRRLGGG